MACVYAFDVRRKPLYFVWAVLFVYFLVDDSYSIHEQVGRSLKTSFGFEPALALRAQDFGELAVSIIAGAVLLGAMALAYRKSDDAAARAFTRLLLPWLGLLIFCGVFVDMLHIQLWKLFWSPVLNLVCEIVEDGGEMIAASFLTAFSVREAAAIRAKVLAAAKSGRGIESRKKAAGRKAKRSRSH